MQSNALLYSVHNYRLAKTFLIQRLFPFLQKSYQGILRVVTFSKATQIIRKIFFYVRIYLYILIYISLFKNFSDGCWKDTNWSIVIHTCGIIFFKDRCYISTLQRIWELPINSRQSESKTEHSATVVEIRKMKVSGHSA